MLQKAIDYACGAGADCKPITPNGQCYNPNSITSHCSYAVNSYYQKNAAKGATCDFSGCATLTNSDPSGGGCSYSATSGSGSTTVPTTSPTTPTSTPISGTGTTPGVTPVSGTGGMGTGGTGTGGMGTGGTGMNPSTTSPYTASPNAGNGVLGGVGTGLAPTGSYDDSHGGLKLQSSSSRSILATLAISTIVFMWN
ncbi:hypothetical protein SOVF_096600 [Spinacia oleracea]|nr:hypothetical protein SOVF_096600 [Spinacia oleracea]